MTRYTGGMSDSVITVTTANVDFALKPDTAARDLARTANGVESDAYLLQEAKRVNLHKQAPKGLKVFQRLKNDATRGSAILWNPKTMDAKGRRRGLTLGTTPHGAAMLNRYIAWVNVQLDNGRVVRLISLHEPPGRYRWLVKFMSPAIVRLLRSSKVAWIVGADWNWLIKNSPDNLDKKTGGRFYGFGIDGFLVHPDLEVINVKRAARTHSDHVPVTIRVRVPQRKG